MECVICVEDISETRKIVCGKCSQTFCVPCCKRFVLERIDPKCPGCPLPWNRQMLLDFFGKTFVNETYRKKREKDLFEREKSLLPEAQRIMIQRSIAEKLNKIDTVLQRNFDKISHYLELSRSREYFDDERIFNVIEAFDHAFDEWDSLLGNPKIFQKDTFKCIVTSVSGEQCRGFVQSGSCGVCGTKFCHACRCREMPDHECDQDAVKTVKLLKKDSKECPKCFAPIFKIDGCDQMWCTLCRTAFSWQTREIVTGRIHNPHYYEYLRTSGPVPREPEDEARCNEGLPHPDQVSNQGFLRSFHRLIVHCREVVMPELLTLTTEEAKLRLRMKFLRGKLSEEQFSKRVFQREEHDEKIPELRAVTNTFIEAGTDIIAASVGIDDQTPFDNAMTSLVNHCNECFRAIGPRGTRWCIVITNDAVRFQ